MVLDSSCSYHTIFCGIQENDQCHDILWLVLSAARPDKLVNTQLNVDTREAFQHYTNATESATDITFNLKDFRHMLALAEGLGANIALLFDRPGHPLIVEPRPRQQDPQASIWQLTAPSPGRIVVNLLYELASWLTRAGRHGLTSPSTSHRSFHSRRSWCSQLSWTRS